ncbi:MAG: GTP cyclohydrolase II [Dehalococcoidia bacterium]
MMATLKVERKVCARIPTPGAEFRILYYTNNRDGQEHMALVAGDVTSKENVLVRVHSECFTGDVLGSLRCDCGSQLALSMERVSKEGEGVVLYMRQEGRGIGLPEKLRAYNLQDLGYDTVDANLLLGHDVDERDYEIAALILQDIGVASVRLLTNNPSKIDGLQKFGIRVTSRETLHSFITNENRDYLRTKAMRMGHLLDLEDLPESKPPGANGTGPILQGILAHKNHTGLPFVTLTYAQSLDGCIARTPGKPMSLSGPESRAMTHGIRAVHDTILVGIGTVITDNPNLTVRLAKGAQPQPVILDSNLRFPLNANLLNNPKLSPWIATTEQAPKDRRMALERAGARVVCLPSNSKGWVDLPALMEFLAGESVGSVMVEGGARVITSFFSERLVDHIVLTVVPVVLGGMRAVKHLEGLRAGCPRLVNPGYQRLGEDMVVWGNPDWREAQPD